VGEKRGNCGSKISFSPSLQKRDNQSSPFIKGREERDFGGEKGISQGISKFYKHPLWTSPDK
jgi:hypothetical protein